MNTLRLRYENGHLIPLEPVPDLHEGEEIVVSWEPQIESNDTTFADIEAMLNRTRGLWVDWIELEDIVDSSKIECKDSTNEEG